MEKKIMWQGGRTEREKRGVGKGERLVMKGGENYRK